MVVVADLAGFISHCEDTASLCLFFNFSLQKIHKSRENSFNYNDY